VSTVVEPPLRAHGFTDGSDMAVGDEFDTKEEAVRKLRSVAMNPPNRFQFKVYKSSKELYIAKCITEGCKWMVRVAKGNCASRFSIRSYCNEHNCNIDDLNLEHMQTSSGEVATLLTQSFQAQHLPSATGTKAWMETNHNTYISYWKAWMGRQLAQNKLIGCPIESYKCLPFYLRLVEKYNPGTITDLVVDDEKIFKYAFLAYGACIRGFSHLRKVVGVDGTWLKTKYKGVMLGQW
jgi:hypothetical protein